MPERFEIYIVYKRRYINTLPFLFPFKCDTCQSVAVPSAAAVALMPFFYIFFLLRTPQQ